ncbi:MAG: flavodoxin family protein [Burkholderiales bacterium]|nr:flavodoxin family protein [Burkholderiales bacterium]
MNILIPYYSRSGHTERLAHVLAEELRKRGHEITLEKIEVERRRNKWRLALPLLSTLPVLPLYLWIAPFRRWWLQHYPQPEMPIKPLSHPHVAAFDAICLGGPKWLYIAYPIARYLRQVEGLEGKRIGAFATFCGPPLEVFELQMLFEPLRQRIGNRGAELKTTLAISSHFHEFFFRHEMEYVFRLVSRLRFGRSLRSFTLDSPWGMTEVQRFCDELCNSSTQPL